MTDWPRAQREFDEIQKRLQALVELVDLYASLNPVATAPIDLNDNIGVANRAIAPLGPSHRRAIRTGRRSRWSVEETRQLLAMQEAGSSLAEIGAALGKTAVQCSDKLHTERRISRQADPASVPLLRIKWTHPQTQILKDMYAEGASPKEIAAATGKEVLQCSEKIKKLKRQGLVRAR